jgi:alkyl hydroperoxide reductase subunit AhpC
MKLIVVSIDEAQNAERVKTTIDGRGWEYEVVLDPNGEFKRQMGVQNPPHTFIVDGKGNIVWSHQGYTDGSEEEIIEKIREIIGE